MNPGPFVTGPFVGLSGTNNGSQLVQCIDLQRKLIEHCVKRASITPMCPEDTGHIKRYRIIFIGHLDHITRWYK